MRLEDHIKRLEKYCEIDRENICYDELNDFGEFCKAHVEDIEAVLKELKRLREYKQETCKKFDECKRKDEELKQKNEIIRCMARFINEYDIDEDICSKNIHIANCEGNALCEECIISFFTEQAREETAQ